MLWVEGINLRHAKERLLMQHQDATDVMDWTHENPEDLEKYLEKVRTHKEIISLNVTPKEV